MPKSLVIYMVIILLAMIGVGSMDFEDQLEQQTLYCEMVSSGVWGDYNGNFKDVCPDERADDAAQEEGSSDQ